MTLRITEIFYSLQGEAATSGLPTTFVRLTGCPLRCGYCDTEYAFSGGEILTLDAILHQVQEFPARRVTVTGGEPLAQPGCHALMTLLADHGYAVSLETSGAFDIADVDPRVSIVMDLKTPGSGECHRNRLENIPLLATKDQVKFVICDRADYEWSRFKIDEYRLADQVGEVLLSASFETLSHRDLADWMLADGLEARLQFQLHKLLWGDKPGV